jgi:hypothetical protein
MFHTGEWRVCAPASPGHGAVEGAPQGSGCAYQVAFFFAIRSGHDSTPLFLAASALPILVSSAAILHRNQPPRFEAEAISVASRAAPA